MVEAVRVGTVLAHDKKAYDRWRSRPRTTAAARAKGLTGAALEAAVMRLAQIFPNNVIVERSA